jgi:hypothetical protein
MLSNEVIITIAQAIIANANVLQSLVDHLPVETKEAVASVVTPAPAAQVVKPKKAEKVEPASVAAPLPVIEPVAAPAPVVATPAPVAAQMPPPPVFTAPAQSAPAHVATSAPFSDPKGLLAYVIASYNALGAQKGAGIQQVLVANGYQNINDVQPDHYAALYAGIEALKV